ncbi:hypothetical protein [Ancylobacter dichloromethanicus]|nr:hypothetical protein [Ancylobacter dichloromethanicus]
MSVADKATQVTRMREIIAVPSVGDHAEGPAPLGKPIDQRAA